MLSKQLRIALAVGFSAMAQATVFVGGAADNVAECDSADTDAPGIFCGAGLDEIAVTVTSTLSNANKLSGCLPWRYDVRTYHSVSEIVAKVRGKNVQPSIATPTAHGVMHLFGLHNPKVCVLAVSRSESVMQAAVSRVVSLFNETLVLTSVNSRQQEALRRAG